MLTAIQKVTFSNGIEYTFTPLNYASTFNDRGKRIEVILQSIKDKTLLKEILTATHKIKLSDGNIGTLTPLGHAMLRNGGKKKIEVILNNIHDPDLLEEILTAKQIVNGEEYTLLQYADRYAPECVTIIGKKMKEAGLAIDHHTSQPTFFDQHKGKGAFVLGVIGAALVAFAFTVPLECGVASAFILGIIAIAAAIGIAGKMAYDKVSERAEKDGGSKWDAVKSIISDILPISSKENNPQKI